MAQDKNDELNTKKFEYILNHAPFSVITINRKLKISYVNKLTPPYDKEEVIGTNILGYLDPNFEELYKQTVNETIGENNPKIIDVQGKSGRHYRLHFIPISLNEKEELMIISQEITGIKSSEKKFRDIFNNIPQPLAIMDQEGIYIDANPAAVELVGYTKEEILNMNNFDIIHPEDHHLAVTPDEINNGLKTYGREMRIIRKDGGVLLIKTNVIPFDIDDKKYRIAIATDITKLREVQKQKDMLTEKVKQGQKFESLGRFASGIAHDYNNYLMAISGYAELASQKIENPKVVEEYLQKIDQITDKAAELSNQMLAYSGKGKIESKPYSLQILLQDILPLIKANISKNTLFKYNIPDNLPLIDVDRTQFEQVILNIVSNANEAIDHNKGIIEITAEHMISNRNEVDHFVYGDLDEGEYILIQIKDNGSGIDPKYLKDIFDPFYTTKFTGRGLGLAVVLGIINGHNAGLHVESELDAGTIFKIYWPITQTEITVSEPRITETDGEIEHVLIVDDIYNVRDAVSKFVEYLGYKAITASNGAEALEIIEQNGSIDLLILDLTMPVMDGIELIHILKKKAIEMNIVVMSGYTEENIPNLNTENVSAYLQKPFSKSDLEKTINQIKINNSQQER